MNIRCTTTLAVTSVDEGLNLDGVLSFLCEYFEVCPDPVQLDMFNETSDGEFAAQVTFVNHRFSELDETVRDMGSALYSEAGITGIVLRATEWDVDVDGAKMITEIAEIEV